MAFRRSERPASGQTRVEDPVGELGQEGCWAQAIGGGPVAVAPRDAGDEAVSGEAADKEIRAGQQGGGLALADERLAVQLEDIGIGAADDAGVGHLGAHVLPGLLRRLGKMPGRRRAAGGGGRRRALRRAISIITILAASLLAIALAAPGVIAEDESGSMAEHPAVGAWLMDDSGTALLHADGTFSSFNPSGEPVFGVWAPGDDGTVNITFAIPNTAEDGTFVGRTIVRVDSTLSDDGMTTMVSATVELPTTDGGTTGQLGPILLTGTKLAVEAPGEPVGPYPPDMPTE